MKRGYKFKADLQLLEERKIKIDLEHEEVIKQKKEKWKKRECNCAEDTQSLIDILKED